MYFIRSFMYNCCEMEVCFGGDNSLFLENICILIIDHSYGMQLDHCIKPFNPLANFLRILCCKAMPSPRCVVGWCMVVILSDSKLTLLFWVQVMPVVIPSHFFRISRPKGRRRGDLPSLSQLSHHHAPPTGAQPSVCGCCSKREQHKNVFPESFLVSSDCFGITRWSF